MRPSLWFCVPAHGRLSLARICLRQLRRTCDALTAEGIDASAVVVADDENLDTARVLGFATVERDNRFLTRRFNDGLQLACDPKFNPRPADFVVPCGSDDWIDHRILLNLPPPDRVLTFERIAFVREDGEEITPHRVRTFIGGCGIRVYPARLLAQAGYRPAEEDGERACDTSTFVGLSRALGGPPPILNGDLHEFQLVDWKTSGEQLNTYQAVRKYKAGDPTLDPFVALQETFPAEALAEMQAHYAQARTQQLVAA